MIGNLCGVESAIDFAGKEGVQIILLSEETAKSAFWNFGINSKTFIENEPIRLVTLSSESLRLWCVDLS